MQQLLVIRLGKSHEFTDHQHGEWSGDIGNEITRTFVDHRINELVYFGPQKRFVIGDSAWSESVSDQPTTLGVFGRIEVDH